VKDDLGSLGLMWREGRRRCDRWWKCAPNLFGSRYNNPVLVIAFSFAEGWAREVSEDVAHESGCAAICIRRSRRPVCKVFWQQQEP